MRGKLSPNAWVLAATALIALVLTITRPSPNGLIPFGMSNREARAAPGEPASSVKTKHNLTALKVFNRTLVRVRDSYVEPSRIDPKRMLYAALDSVQFNIPEVLVEAYPDRDLVTVSVNDKRAEFPTTEVDSPWRLSAELKKIFRFIETNMNPGADLAQVEYAAVNGMLSTLDPHSILLDPEMAREMDVNTSGKFGGLGIVIGMRKKQLTVIRPMKGTPAQKAGVKARDGIVKIDNELTENLTLNEAVDRMRGKPGTNVILWVKRDGQNSLMKFDLTRDVIRVPSVESKLLSKNVGYLKIKQFAGNTAQEVRGAMTALAEQGAKAWVLDMRWNPGGLLEQAIQVADLFVESGTIVTTIGGGEREPRRAARRDTDVKSPMVVLINGSSASASEIVAGALKHLDRALTVGSTSFGKGSVQILYDNSDGSKLKLTIAQYLTPDNLSLQSLGIVPDIALERMYVPKQNQKPKDVVRLLPPSRSYREKDLKDHLDSKFAKEPPKADMSMRFLYEMPPALAKLQAEEDEEAPPAGVEEEEEEDLAGDEIIEDFEIELARDLLVAAGDPTRKGMLKKAKKFIEKREVTELKKLGSALTTLGVDWSPAPNGAADPTLESRFALEGVTGGNIAAGQEVKLVGTVKNIGKAPAYRVHARLRADDRVFDDTEQVFGKIEPGQTRTWSTYLKMPDDSLDRFDEIRFEITDATGKTHGADPLKVSVKSAARPVFAYSHQLIDDSNGDGLVQPGEKHRLRVTVKNTGKGEARESAAVLRNASGDDIRLEKARFELGAIKPGQEQTVEFSFETNDKMASPEAVVELTVYDAVLRESVGEKLKYPVQTDLAGPSAQSGGVRPQKAAVAIYEGASRSSAQIGSATRGATYDVTGRLGEWYRVKLSDNRPGFIHEDDVSKTRATGKPAAFDLRWQVTPPTISLKLPSLVSPGSTYDLRGTASDDSKVEDVYIFVSNADAKVDNKKVYYQSNRKGQSKSQLAFNTQIPLWPGSNAVTVVARENDEVRSSQTVFLYREQTRTAASKP